MAERRMFAKTITESDAFLDMPFSTQALYFHMCMEADDDGFLNNPKKIQRVIGASEEDIKTLIEKRFIIPFESGIIVIKHWKIHNYIQNDRYKPTTYIEERELLIIKTNKAYSLADDSLMDTNSIQSVYNSETNCPHRLGEDNKNNKIYCQKIIESFNNICSSLPKVTKLTKAREKTINARLNEGYSIEDLEKAFRKAEESEFLSGKNGKWGACNFDWIMNPNNIVKILEGNYRNKAEDKPKAEATGEEMSKEDLNSFNGDIKEIISFYPYEITKEGEEYLRNFIKNKNPRITLQTAQRIRADLINNQGKEFKKSIKEQLECWKRELNF